jgi:hypothetical protein
MTLISLKIRATAVQRASSEMGKSQKRKQPTMAGTFHGSVGPNPNWLGGRRILYLHVPFADKDTVKALGAKWNTDRRMWWIFADVNRTPFLPWLRDDRSGDLNPTR